MDASPPHPIQRRATVPWVHRLEARVALGITLLVGAALAIVLAATQHLVRSNARHQATADVDATREAFQHLIETRAESASAQLRLVTTLPVFRSYLPGAPGERDGRSDAERLASDQASLLTMVEGYRSALDAEFLIVANTRQRWVASPGWRAGDDVPADLTRTIRRAQGGKSGQAIVVADNHLFLVVSQPARFADEVLGTATAGYRLDDTVARELARTTRSDVTLLAGTFISGSSLGSAQQQTLRRILLDEHQTIGRTQNPTTIHWIGGAPYIGGSFLIRDRPTGPSTGTLVLLRDWQPLQAAIDDVRLGVLQVGGALFALALGVGLIASRRITRPLSEMCAATAEVAAGHWDRRLAVRGVDEVAAVALAFNEMTTALSHWHSEAQARENELEESTRRFAAVTHSANDAIVSVDEAGRILFWNASAERTFGYGSPEALGTRFQDLLTEASYDIYRKRVGRLRAGDTSFGSMFECVGVHRAGTVFPIEVSVATWTAGNQLHLTLIVRDIAERKQAEATLQRRDDELRQAQKMEAVGRLAGGVAHDFSNVLTAIHGYAELLMLDLHTDQARETLREIVKAATTAESLTRQLLAFSRKQALAPLVLALDDTVLGLENMLRRLIGEDIHLQVSAEAGLWHVKADPGQIEQVVINLAVNARDAMPEGGTLTISLANRTVTAASGCTSELVELEVRDTGVGMSPEMTTHIFEPFFTTKDHGRGTGLGLATVYGIVEQSGGTIAVESGLGEGTTFRVRVPRTHDAPSSEAPALLVTNGHAFETILLVEDDPAVRRLAEQALARDGYRILKAESGAQALEQAAAHRGPIHLLLTDVVMPGMNGRALWERVSALRTETSILFMSGYSDAAVERHGIPHDSLPLLRKPFSVTSLTEGVRRALTDGRAA